MIKISAERAVQCIAESFRILLLDKALGKIKYHYHKGPDRAKSQRVRGAHFK
jgi:hypothetical protein